MMTSIIGSQCREITRTLRFLRVITRLLYRARGTGAPRIAEYIRRRTARWAAANPEKAQVWIDDFWSDSNFCCDLAEHMGSQIFFKGSYSGGQLALLCQLLPTDGVLIDVGANQGEFTICGARHLLEGRVFSFEPVPSVRQRLMENIDANGLKNVTVFPIGLSDSAVDGIPIFGADALFRDGTKNIGLPTIFGVAGRNKQLATIDLRPLDDLVPDTQRVDVMKVDVEGAELSVFKGAVKTIEREKPAIIFEANQETCKAAGYTVPELFDWLKERGYQLQAIHAKGRLKKIDKPIQFCNVLALHRDRAALNRVLAKA